MNTTEELYRLYLAHRKVTTDSREVPVGSIFFALKGENFDGHRFVGEALRKGAALAVVDDPAYLPDERCFLVRDVLQQLQDLARRHRRELKATVIAITGSNGKTTTKELMNQVLRTTFTCTATAGNLNNHIGVPLTILSLSEEQEFAIIEMGANHQGEIRELCLIADPEYGIITNVGKAHLEGFGGFEGVVRAKTELYQHLRDRDGFVFLNSANEILANKASGINQIRYGAQADPVHGTVLIADPALEVACTIGDDALRIRTQLVGDYNLENILAAACVGSHFGVPASAIGEAVEQYVPANNRSQILQTPKNTLILDAYNANPTSMEAAIRNFAAGQYEQKVLLLGEMLELGADSQAEHHRVIGLARELGFDAVFVVGEGFRDAGAPDARWFETTDQLIGHLQKHPLAGNAILIKGSRGNQMERLINYL